MYSLSDKKLFTLSELQDVLYDMLKAFAEFCDENDLRYYLYGGTLLGAVRHQGFIPWDDDVDVAMPRPDYERFIELTKNSPWEYYAVCQYTQPFIKMVDTRTVMEERQLRDELGMQSAFIDIFPIDGLPESGEERQKHFRKLAILKQCLYFSIFDIKKIKSSNFLKRIAHTMIYIAFSKIDYKKIRDAIAEEAKRYPYETSEYVSVGIWGKAERDLNKKEDLEKRIRLKFRDSYLWCQGNYDESLRLKYGEYMQLPPEDKRQPFHGIYYWKKENDKG